MMKKGEDDALIAYMVKRLREQDENKQIGKTVVQKMAYLLELNSDVDFDYTMYHYGPFSRRVAGLLDMAEKNGYVDIKWNSDKGYFIEPKEDIPEDNLDGGIKKSVDDVVNRYSKYLAIDLSLIATGHYVKDNYEYESDDRLVEIVLSLKSDYGEEKIRKLLLDEKIIAS